jgi:hypothetical protein
MIDIENFLLSKVVAKNINKSKVNELDLVKPLSELILKGKYDGKSIRDFKIEVFELNALVHSVFVTVCEQMHKDKSDKDGVKFKHYNDTWSMICKKLFTISKDPLDFLYLAEFIHHRYAPFFGDIDSSGDQRFKFAYKAIHEGINRSTNINQLYYFTYKNLDVYGFKYGWDLIELAGEKGLKIAFSKRSYLSLLSLCFDDENNMPFGETIFNKAISVILNNKSKIKKEEYLEIKKELISFGRADIAKKL